MDYQTNIEDYITKQETAFRNTISLIGTWNWGMKDHIETTVLYKNSQLKSGKDDFKPVKNIVLPIIRMQYRAEGFDVKDIQIFVNDKDDYFKSFLVRKFHEKWARENDIDTFIDALVESYVDFGGVLVKNVNDVKPEVVSMQTIAFCDQTDILSGPIGIKHYYSPDQLLAMGKVGWGKKSNGATATLQEVIALAKNEKKQDKNNATVKTPGKYVEVYEVHGNFPKSFLDPMDTSGEYSSQIHICSFYQKKDSDAKGYITLYAAEEKESPFKFLARDGIYGRALGLGGVEELFEAQVWTNYDMIRKQDMLDSASKTLLQTTDPAIAKRNRVRDMDNMEIITVEDGKRLEPVNTFPMNMKLLDMSAAEWAQHAHEIGSATGALLGEMPSTHTSYNMMALVTSQGQAIHDYRRGKISTFVGEIYRDWVLPYITKEITNGQTFLAELDMDELQSVADSVVTYASNQLIKQKILNGETIDPAMIDTYRQQTRDQFMKKGNKHFIEIFKGEMKDTPMDVEISIANKQKDLGKITESLKGIVSFLFSTFNPQTGSFAAFDDPRVAGILNQVLEASGLDQVDTYAKPPQQQLPQGQTGQQMQQGQPQPSPIQQQQPQTTSPAQFQASLTR